MQTPIGTYQRPTSSQTLSEGIQEYYQRNPGLTVFKPEDPAAELFIPHDACHVLFGLGTAVLEEALVDYWTIFGTDVGIKTYFSYAKHVSEINLGAVSHKLGRLVFARETVRSVPYIWKVWRNAKKMNRPWSFHGYAQHLDKPLTELRSIYGIELIGVPQASRRFSSVAQLQS